jgi:hypothetical protein
MTEMSDEKLERLRQMDPTMWEVCDLIKKRRPDLYPSDGDVSHIMGMIDRAWSPGMSEEEVFAEVEAQLDGARIPIFGVELTLDNQEKIDALMKDIQRMVCGKPRGHVLAALAGSVTNVLSCFEGDEFTVMLFRFASEVANFNFKSWRKDSPQSSH